LATCFHPELTTDPRLHARFLALEVPFDAQLSAAEPRVAAAPRPASGAGRPA
jgi:hypothetical protein